MPQAIPVSVLCFTRLNYAKLSAQINTETVIVWDWPQLQGKHAEAQTAIAVMSEIFLDHTAALRYLGK